MIIGIIAVAKNFAIGKNGILPWHYPLDLKFFKETTLDSAVVMGFNTWKSIGKPLPKRLNIVLSRLNSIDTQKDVLLLRSKEEIITISKYLNVNVFIIGGAKTYTELGDIIEKWIVTEIPQTIENADVFMPKNFLNNFECFDTITLEDNLSVKSYLRKS